MAEDKKIRISADLSQLRALRDEATGLQRELNQLSSSTGGADDSIAKLKEQLSLLGERNDLEKLFGELKKKNEEANSSSNKIPLQEPPSKNPQNIEREIVNKPSSEVRDTLPQEKKEIHPQSGVQRDHTPTPQEETSISAEEISEEKPKKKKAKKEKEESQAIVQREIIEPKDEETPVEILWDKASRWQASLFGENPDEELDKPFVEPSEKRKDRSSEQRDITPDSNESEPEEIKPEKPKKKGAKKDKEKVQRDIVPDQEEGNSLSKDRGDFINILSFLEKWKASQLSLSDSQDITLKEIKDLVAEIKNASGGNGGDNGGVTPLAGGDTTDPGVPPKKKKKKEDKEPDVGPGVKGMVGAWLAAKGIQSAFDKIAEVIEIVKERHIRTLQISASKEYMDPIQSVEAYTSYQGKQKADNYSWIPFVGDIAAKEITTLADAKAQQLGVGLRSAVQLETQVRPYSQTFGVSNERAENIALKEGGYAASALGIDAGEYSTKRAQLVRAGGGVKEIAGVRESQSLMAAERMYGMSPNSTSQLQGTMRFSEKNTESTNSSSSVIRIFEQTMKDLKKPFSEIASTIEESLNTFNRTADSILSKAGDFDATKVAGVLAGIRAYTGAEGKQLERYQESFSGQSISQDEVTQALLLRTVSKIDSSVKTFSDAKSKIETIEEDPVLMKSFMKELQGLTQNNEQFINVLKAVFPKLSYTDIKDEVEKPGFSIDALYNKILMATKKIEKDRDKKNQYEKDAAKKTVGVLEAFNTNYQNQMKGYGASISGDVARIKAELEKLRTATPVKDSIDKTVDMIAEAMLKLGSKVAPEKGKTDFFAQSKAMTGATLMMMGLLIKQITKDKD